MPQMESIQDQLNNAIWRASLSDVVSLLAAGASPNKPDSKSWTPLMMAVESSNVGILELLLRSGADVNIRGIDNCTCLHIAVDCAVDSAIQNKDAQGNESTEIIELLLDNGAEILAQDDNGKTPLDWAREYQSATIIRLLETYTDA